MDVGRPKGLLVIGYGTRQSRYGREARGDEAKGERRWVLYHIIRKLN